MAFFHCILMNPTTSKDGRYIRFWTYFSRDLARSKKTAVEYPIPFGKDINDLFFMGIPSFPLFLRAYHFDIETVVATTVTILTHELLHKYSGK
ncbi:hypothetical protein FB479_11335 [Brevibacillus sp. AG162]|nr:hypothetical protein FB479_11335 [Brevibacillus sp. AG162]